MGFNLLGLMVFTNILSFLNAFLDKEPLQSAFYSSFEMDHSFVNI